LPHRRLIAGQVNPPEIRSLQQILGERFSIYAQPVQCAFRQDEQDLPTAKPSWAPDEGPETHLAQRLFGLLLPGDWRPPTGVREIVLMHSLYDAQTTRLYVIQPIPRVLRSDHSRLPLRHQREAVDV
jgi:hypothetical protein